MRDQRVRPRVRGEGKKNKRRGMRGRVGMGPPRGGAVVVALARGGAVVARPRGGAVVVGF